MVAVGRYDSIEGVTTATTGSKLLYLPLVVNVRRDYAADNGAFSAVLYTPQCSMYDLKLDHRLCGYTQKHLRCKKVLEFLSLFSY